MIDIQYNETFKYADLAKALRSLDFKEHMGVTDLGIPYRAFFNEPFDALITLPKKDDSDVLEPVHLRKAERTVEARGVADSATLFRLLRDAGKQAA
jgi:hypothetical protein